MGVNNSAVDLEEGVLGAIISTKDALYMVINIVNEESFTSDFRKAVWRSVLALHQKGTPIDILTTKNHLVQSGVSESMVGYEVAVLTNKVASNANIEAHARILNEYQIKRNVKRVCLEQAAKADDPTVDALDLQEETLSKLGSIDEFKTDVMLTTPELHAQMLQNIKDGAGNDGVTGIPTGLKILDKTTGGWPVGLTIIAARPSMGKTAFAIKTGETAVSEGHPCLIFSLDSKAIKIHERRASAASKNIPYLDIVRAKVPDLEAFKESTKHFEKKDELYIDEKTKTLSGIVSKIRKYVIIHGIEEVIVDYLQCVENEKKGRNREGDISHITRTLKNLGNELGIPIIALSQLSREVEKRSGDFKPQLSDLRESGAIEQDAEMVIMPFRPEYYGLTDPVWIEGREHKTDHLMILLLLKFKSGERNVELPTWIDLPTNTLKDYDYIVESNVRDGDFKDHDND